MRRTRLQSLFICVVLVVLTVAVFGQVVGFGFTLWDDNVYVTQNPFIQLDLNPQSVKWAFGALCCSNWHPLTWLSLMSDFQVHGLDSRVFHATNLALHIANVLLLYALLCVVTGRRWPAAAVAALFAIHPLHVESVAWVAERKDVLSTFFWLLTTIAYVKYARSPSVTRYALVFGLYALGLMAKPMLVTLPITLMLLDFWPLRRFRVVSEDSSKSWDWRDSLREKIPLVPLTIASCYLTLLAQRLGRALTTVQDYPVGVRLANAVVAYFQYLWKTVWPINLACYYPHPKNTLPQGLVAACAVGLVAVTLLAITSARRRPYIAFGWLWYLITLLPVVGLVQVGMQSGADRYTYVPLIGVFVALVWWVADVAVSHGKTAKLVLGLAASIAIMILAVMAWKQTGYWKNDITLFGHCLANTGENEVIEYKYAFALDMAGRKDEAIEHYKAAIRLNPRRSVFYGNLGAIYLEQGKPELAIPEFRKMLVIRPKDPLAHVYLGDALLRTGRREEAIAHYRKALDIQPGFQPALESLKAAGASWP